ncbi:MAG TPA: enoyl-CoA hydratase/isomerase family protein [Myxococcaceae bacterium]|nr:enoyl-CoA hydratase/isomerase family protein [Myxococcaceae bacterium]
MKIETTGDVAVLPMRAGKANAIGAAFLDRLSAQLDAVESSRARALVLTGEGRAFSAGLDLPELSALDPSGLERFIRRFSEVMLRVFALPVPVVAAINGHAIAGGCVLAMQADVRLAAAGDYRLGLNEVQIGLGLPAVVLETLRCQVSPQALGPVALEGRLLVPEEAQALGLVEAVVPPEQLLEQARSRAAALGALPRPAFQEIKQSLRGPVVETVRRVEREDARHWVETAFSASARERLAEVVARLTRPR